MRHPAASEAAACSAALTLALPLLLFLLLCASQLAAAQQQQAQQVQPQQDVAAQCPLAVRYEVSLGQGQSATPQVPIFLASLGLQNNANVSACGCGSLFWACLPQQWCLRAAGACPPPCQAGGVVGADHVPP